MEPCDNEQLHSQCEKQSQNRTLSTFSSIEGVHWGHVMLGVLLLGYPSLLVSTLLPVSQLPKRVENCLPIPTFSQEVEKSRAEQQKRAPQPIRVQIQSFTLTPIDSLPSGIASQVAADVKAKVDGGELNRDWIEETSLRVQQELQHYGYFYAVAKPPEVNVLYKTGKTLTISTNIRVEARGIYRLGEITFQHGHALSPEKMRELFPIQREEVLDTSKISAGIQSLRRMYGELGYVDFIVVPTTQNETSASLLNLTLDIEEGPQFRVGRFEILGMEQADAQKLIAESGLRPGKIFNPMLVERFFEANKSVLPGDAKADDDTEFQWHVNEGTVDLIMDFRSCR